MITAWIAVVAGVLVLVAGRWHRQVMSAPQGAPAPWPSIVALELAGSGQVMANLLDRLGMPGVARVRTALRIDGAIILGYVLLLGSLCLLSRRTVQAASSGALETSGEVVAVVMAGAVVLAGALDLVENWALGSVLNGYQPQVVPDKPDVDEAAGRATLRREVITRIDSLSRIARVAAIGKFSLLAAAALWLFAVLVIIVTRALA